MNLRCISLLFALLAIRAAGVDSIADGGDVTHFDHAAVPEPGLAFVQGRKLAAVASTSKTPTSSRTTSKTRTPSKGSSKSSTGTPTISNSPASFSMTTSVTATSSVSPSIGASRSNSKSPTSTRSVSQQLSSSESLSESPTQSISESESAPAAPSAEAGQSSQTTFTRTRTAAAASPALGSSRSRTPSSSATESASAPLAATMESSTTRLSTTAISIIGVGFFILVASGSMWALYNWSQQAAEERKQILEYLDQPLKKSEVEVQVGWPGQGPQGATVAAPSAISSVSHPWVTPGIFLPSSAPATASAAGASTILPNGYTDMGVAVGNGVHQPLVASKEGTAVIDSSSDSSDSGHGSDASTGRYTIHRRQHQHRYHHRQQRMHRRTRSQGRASTGSDYRPGRRSFESGQNTTRNLNEAQTDRLSAFIRTVFSLQKTKMRRSRSESIGAGPRSHRWHGSGTHRTQLYRPIATRRGTADDGVLPQEPEGAFKAFHRSSLYSTTNSTIAVSGLQSLHPIPLAGASVLSSDPEVAALQRVHAEKALALKVLEFTIANKLSSPLEPELAFLAGETIAPTVTATLDSSGAPKPLPLAKPLQPVSIRRRTRPKMMRQPAVTFSAPVQVQNPVQADLPGVFQVDGTGTAHVEVAPSMGASKAYAKLRPAIVRRHSSRVLSRAVAQQVYLPPLRRDNTVTFEAGLPVDGELIRDVKTA